MENSQQEQRKERGRLVVVEGPDRAGKTTCAKRLAEKLGYLYVKLPDRSTPTGQLLDRFIRGEVQFASDRDSNERAAQMVFAANNMERRKWLIDQLEAGRSLVLDRYIYSACVYHAQAVGYRADNFIYELNRGMPIPDLAVVFEVKPEVAAARGGFGEERNDSVEVQRAVGEGYRRLLVRSEHPLFVGDCRVEYVDANPSVDTVYAKLEHAVSQLTPTTAEPLGFY